MPQRPIKQELESPKRIEPPRAPRSLLTSGSNAEGTSEFSNRRPLSPSRAFVPSYHHNNHYKDDRYPREAPPEDRYKLASYRSLDANRPYNPLPPRGRSISPSPRSGRFSQNDGTSRPAGYAEDRKPQPVATHRSWQDHARTPYQRHSFNSDKRDTPAGWFHGGGKGLKRPLSPTETSPSRRSSSPKRRYSAVEHAGPRVGSPIQVDVPTRPSSTNTTETVEDASAPPSRNQRITILNRELWDVRRQITALKAREDNILTDLKTMRAPELAESTVAAPQQRTPGPDDRVKQLEAEVHCTCVCGGRAVVAVAQRTRTCWLCCRDESARCGFILT
jgi:hypothetical protein